MPLIVVDASVLATALADDGPDGRRARERLRGDHLAAPHLVDLEVASVWRRQCRAGKLPQPRAAAGLRSLQALPLDRLEIHPLLPRCWELRDAVTVYDASYVALAEALGVVLLTADLRLSRAPGLRCVVEVFGPPAGVP